MAITITGVPESITRADYIALIESIGLDASRIKELTFRWNHIEALVNATDDRGRLVVDPASNEVVRHRVAIHVTDGGVA